MVAFFQTCTWRNVLLFIETSWHMLEGKLFSHLLMKLEHKQRCKIQQVRGTLRHWLWNLPISDPSSQEGSHYCCMYITVSLEVKCQGLNCQAHLLEFFIAAGSHIVKKIKKTKPWINRKTTVKTYDYKITNSLLDPDTTYLSVPALTSFFLSFIPHQPPDSVLLPSLWGTRYYSHWPQ